jgi:hypothetical protein
MASDQVLRFPCTGDDGGHLLTKVSKSGTKPLDLELIATDGDNVFSAALKESAVKSLQASNYGGNLDEWKTILKYTLLQEHPDEPLPEELQGLKAVATVDESTAAITLRKNISGIVQRLGTIKLKEDDPEKLNLFDLAVTAAGEADGLRIQLRTLQNSARFHQEEVTKLNRQLDDLIQAKEEHEDDLLKKVAALLNAKKLKIRDQQRLLAGAKIDPHAAEAVSAARDGSTSRTAGASRRGKRKANGVAEPQPEPEGGGENEDDYQDGDDFERQETPPPSDQDATEDEGTDGEGLDAAPAASQRSTRAAASKGKAGGGGADAAPAPSQRSTRASGSKRKAAEATKGKANVGTTKDVRDDGPPPPKRELPFKTQTGGTSRFKEPEPAPAPASTIGNAGGDEDDDTTDDEL